APPAATSTSTATACTAPSRSPPPPAWASSRSGQAPPCSCAAPSGPDEHASQKEARPRFPRRPGLSLASGARVPGVQLRFGPKHNWIYPMQERHVADRAKAQPSRPSLGLGDVGWWLRARPGWRADYGLTPRQRENPDE